MTAFAIFGSATSTSLTSRGRSMIDDLPTPSERKRVFGATLGMLEVVAGAASLSAAVAGEKPEIGASAAAKNDKALMIRVRSDVRLPLRAMFFVLLVIAPFWSLRCRGAWIVDAIADHVDAGTLGRIVGADRHLVDVGDAAQRERQDSGLPRCGERGR